MSVILSTLWVCFVMSESGNHMKRVSAGMEPFLRLLLDEELS